MLFLIWACLQQYASGLQCSLFPIVWWLQFLLLSFYNVLSVLYFFYIYIYSGIRMLTNINGNISPKGGASTCYNPPNSHNWKLFCSSNTTITSLIELQVHSYFELMSLQDDMHFFAPSRNSKSTIIYVYWEDAKKNWWRLTEVWNVCIIKPISNVMDPKMIMLLYVLHSKNLWKC